MSVWTKFQRNTSNSCLDMSRQTTNINRMVEKGESQQSMSERFILWEPLMQVENDNPSNNCADNSVCIKVVDQPIHEDHNYLIG